MSSHTHHPTGKLTVNLIDYSIFTWRMNPSGHPGNPTIFVHNPSTPLPTPPSYQNPSYYAFRAPLVSVSSFSSLQSMLNGTGGGGGGGIAPSIRSARSKRSTRSKAGSDPGEDYKTKFNRFHSENGVRTVNGKIGPVEGGKFSYLCCFLM